MLCLWLLLDNKSIWLRMWELQTLSRKIIYGAKHFVKSRFSRVNDVQIKWSFG